MTTSVPSYTEKTWQGDGSTTAFSFQTPVMESGDLKVWLIDADGTMTLQSLTTHYTLSGLGDPSGVTITFLTTPSATKKVKARREHVSKQTVDYGDTTKVPGETTETQLDRLARVGQDLDGRIAVYEDAADVDAIETAAASAAQSASEAADQKSYAQEWAQSDDPISEDAGGNGTTDRSAKWWKEQTEQIAFPDETVTRPKLSGPLSSAVSPGAIENGAVGDGATNDDGAFAAIKAAYPGRVVELGGQSYALSALPYADTPDEDDPIYANGVLRVDGEDYPSHGVGSVISAVNLTKRQNTAHRAALIASDRSEAGTDSHPTHGDRMQAVVAGSSRSKAYTQNSLIGGCTNTYLQGAFNGGALGNREVLLAGEQAGSISSRLSRIYGLAGFTDDGYLFERDNVTTFDPAYLSSTSAGETFRNSIIACLAVDITEGSDNVALASRGDADLSGGIGVVADALRVGGSRVAAIACQGGSAGKSVNGTGNLAAAVQFPQLGSDSVYSAALASREAVIGNSGDTAFIAATSGAYATGTQVAAIASYNVEAWGTTSAAIGVRGTGGSSVVVNADSAVAAASRNITAKGDLSNYALCGGYTTSAVTNDGTSRNQKWRLESNGGIGRFAGGTATTGLDYAEFFENVDAGIIEPGHVIVFELGTRKVRVGREDDKPSQIIGVLSATPSVIGNSHDFDWQGRFERDDWGRLVKAPYDMVRWPGTDGNRENGEWPRKAFDGRVSDLESATGLTIDQVPDDAEFYTEMDLVERDEYDPTLPYVPREDRPAEYSIVGMTGQLLARVGVDVESGDYVAADGGKSGSMTKIVCMEIVQPFDAQKGYAQAWCLVG